MAAKQKFYLMRYRNHVRAYYCGFHVASIHSRPTGNYVTYMVQSVVLPNVKPTMSKELASIEDAVHYVREQLEVKNENRSQY